jgi:hypothetical protein
MKSDVRVSGGYRLIYLPDHDKAMSLKNWDGYVYEHIVVAGDYLGRPLREDEEVHHLNGDPLDNRHGNLLVLPKSQHAKLHAWINSGALGIERLQANRVNSMKAEDKEPLFCAICQRTLQDQAVRYCSPDCTALGRRKVVRPSVTQLSDDLKKMSFEKVGAKYGVSGNAVRKWIKQYSLITSTLSQASGTPEEGAETSGEVVSPLNNRNSARHPNVIVEGDDIVHGVQ